VESIATTIVGKTSNQPLVRMNKVPEATDEFPESIESDGYKEVESRMLARIY